MYLHFDCDPSHEVSHGIFSTVTSYQPTRKFLILKHLGLWNFSVYVVNYQKTNLVYWNSVCGSLNVIGPHSLIGRGTNY